MRLSTVASYSVVCHQHRCCLPLKYLSQDAPQHGWEIIQNDQTRGFDVLYLYGVREFSDFVELAQLKRQGVKFIWGMDDTLWDWPHWRKDEPSQENLGAVALAAELADFIVASTPAMMEDIRKPAKTIVCPNLVEVGAYRLAAPPADDEVVRILWSGSATHKADLDVVDGACCRIKEKWGDKVEFHFFGTGPSDLLMKHWNRGVHLADWCPYREYHYRLHLARPHISLAPLHPCRFNEVKSNLRVIEAWAMNSACIASPVGEYKFIRDHKDGLLCETEDDWFWAMDGLIRDRKWRESLARAGYERVKAEWDWSNPIARRKWAGLVAKLDEWDRESAAVK